MNLPTKRLARRLTTILAADVVGYTRLIGTDEEGTLARLRAVRNEQVDPAIAAFHGRIVKTTGDGLLVEFASVVDSVRAALAIQRSMAGSNADLAQDQRLEFRVGINLGDVVVEDDGDLMGDGVNIAARLEGLAEPGGICLSAMAYENVVGKINIDFTDLGPQSLKNIARPVHTYAIGMSAERTNSKPILTSRAAAFAPRLSIVVLPLSNLGADSEQDFVDSVTDSLTTDLSRIPGSFVIARNTAFTFKGRAVDARKVGRELGVRYVLEGSLQTGDNRIRVNAQLIDAETGAHLWAERFDKPRADLFDMQDEITTRLARTVGFELIEVEGQRAERERPDNMDAVDLTLRARAIMNRPTSLENARLARPLFEAALRLDENDVDALVGLADTHGLEVRLSASKNRDEDIRIADALINKALVLAPNNALAHNIRAEVLFLMRAPERALVECELALALDGNLPRAYVDAGYMKLLVGRGEETEADVRDSIRLSPRDPELSFWYIVIGIADLSHGRFEQAIENLQRGVGMNPRGVAVFHFLLAAALALAGRTAEATAASDAGLKLDPTYSVARARDEDQNRSVNSVYLMQRERFYEGLRQVGVPESTGLLESE